MKTKHTPGPWTQGTSEEGKSCVWLDGHTEPKEEMGPDNTWIDCGTEANARLIAAAPDLLEALIDCRRSLKIANFTQELQVVNAALAKATGEQS